MAAGDAGLQALLIEPTQLSREVPHTVDQSCRLAANLRGRTAVPVRYVLDVGHALYRPFYGDSVALADWLAPLKEEIGVLHFQNHDFNSDAHWGWPDGRGDYDVASFAREVRQAGVDAPVVIELFYPFEMADEAVLANVNSSVRHCAEQLGP